ncbi:MAG TPA: GTP-binding protein [Bryobacteraceae bacterium]|jgi:hypothetical protein|nr:GTP-binding protein [Bryobacteraceae bacterium]
MAKPWLIVIGGFLGAGKTTLILQAARVLCSRGLRVAAILNDQGGGLVDTGQVRRHGIPAGEVAGACFCCRFSDLLDRAAELRKAEPDVIFAEPVGSCTDLSATILQPLKRDFRDQYRIAPFTVLVDPEQAERFTTTESDTELGFLFQQQIAEADIVAFTKIESGRNFAALPVPEVRYLSGITGQGVASWLNELFSGSITAGSKLLDIDYQRYAEAEAALGWLNWTATLQLSNPLGAAELVGPFVDTLLSALETEGARIAHLKVLDETPGSYLKVAATGNTEQPHVEGDLTASPETLHEIRVNLRAVIEPGRLKQVFARQMEQLPGSRSGEVLECFSPGAPKPERRLGVVVT